MKDLTGAYQAALSRSGGQQGNDLYNAAQSIKRSLTTLPNTDLAAPILYLLQAISDAGIALFGSPAALPLVLDLAASMTDVGVTAATNDGNPVADKVLTTVDQLAAEIGSNVAHAANGLDGLRAVANSDYGRLMALSDVETSQKGSWVSSISHQLTISADAYFSQPCSRLPTTSGGWCQSTIPRPYASRLATSDRRGGVCQRVPGLTSDIGTLETVRPTTTDWS